MPGLRNRRSKSHRSSSHHNQIPAFLVSVLNHFFSRDPASLLINAPEKTRPFPDLREKRPHRKDLPTTLDALALLKRLPSEYNGWIRVSHYNFLGRPRRVWAEIRAGHLLAYSSRNGDLITVADIGSEIKIGRRYFLLKSGLKLAVDLVWKNVLKKMVVRPRFKPADWEKIHELGRGSYGRVWLVKNKNFSDMPFRAMKIVEKRAICASREKLRRALDERFILQLSRPENENGITSPFLVKFEGAMQSHSRLYLLTEYCEQGDLAHVLDSLPLKKFDERTVQRLAAELVLGLETLHSNGILHRDIKPSNILLTGGHVRIADFGVSKPFANVASDWGSDVDDDTTEEDPRHVPTEESLSNQRANSFVGTTRYQAVELVRRESYSTEADVYALGVTLFRLVTGTTPFEDVTKEKVWQKIENEEICFPLYLSPNAKDLLGRMLERSVTKRATLEQVKSHPFFDDLDFEKTLACDSLDKNDMLYGYVPLETPRTPASDTEMHSWSWMSVSDGDEDEVAEDDETFCNKHIHRGTSRFFHAKSCPIETKGFREIPGYGFHPGALVS